MYGGFVQKLKIMSGKLQFMTESKRKQDVNFALEDLQAAQIMLKSFPLTLPQNGIPPEAMN